MRRFALLLALAALAACSKTPDEVDAGGDGGAPVDACNTAADALGAAECQLTLGDGGAVGYIFPGGDHDWWHLRIDTVPDRALLTVTAGIAAPSSRVNLQVLVFQGTDGSSSLGSATDPRLRGAPSPTTVVSRITQPGDYFVLVQNDSTTDDDPDHPSYDARNPYTLTASLASDVDVNEPNDTLPQATVIPLSANQGQSAGALATAGDVDVYAIDIPAGSAPPNRWVLYTALDAPDLTPDSAIRLGYSINLDDGTGADGGNVTSGHALSPSGEQQASTALLVPQSGRFYITVQPYLANPTTDTPPPGDPRLSYTLSVKLVPDDSSIDPHEPDDTPAQADGQPVNLASPSNSTTNPSRTLSGRIGYVPDPDWYTVVLQGSQGQNTRLRYTLSFDDAAPNSKRFPPAGLVYPSGKLDDHQVTVAQPYSDANLCGAQCPNSGTAIGGIVTSGCARPSHECIYSYRSEGPLDGGSGGVSNFQGEIPVPAHSGDATFHILVEDQGNNGADDRAYTLNLWWLTETADDASSGHDVLAPENTPVSLAPPLNGSYSEDPGNAGAANGSFSFGHGVLADYQAPNAPVIPIKNEIDYDAVNDTDYYRIQIPKPAPLNAFPDGGFADGGASYPALAWSSAWTLPAAAGMSVGERPYDLQMTYFFCDPNDNASCDPQGTWHAIPVGYRSGDVGGWTGVNQPGWKVDPNAGRFVTNAGECFCIEPRFVKGGTMYMAVTGISRASYEDAPYTVNTAFAPYPQTYDGGQSCPDFTADGGGRTCSFCSQQFGSDCKRVDGIVLPRQLP